MTVNPNEAPEGYIAVESCGNLFEDCRRCAFLSCFEIGCTGGQREDGESMFFVKKPPETGSGYA